MSVEFPVKNFYILDDPIVTCDNWLEESKTENDYGHNDYYLYKDLLKHPWRVNDPTEAQIIVIAIPIAKLYFNLDIQAFRSKMKIIMQYLRSNSLFTSSKCKLFLAAHYEISAWNKMFFCPKFAQEFEETFKDCVSTRYEVYNNSKWSKPPLTISSQLPKLVNVKWEMTMKSVCLPYAPFVGKIEDPNFSEWQKRKHLLFYVQSRREFGHNATRLRMFPFDSGLNKREDSFIVEGFLPLSEFSNNMCDSKYVFCLRGDTPGTHHFINAVSAGCIPVIISKLFSDVCVSFEDQIPLSSFSISFTEEEFLADPNLVVEKIMSIDKDQIESKLLNLSKAQKFLLFDHKESVLSSEVLKKAVI